MADSVKDIRVEVKVRNNLILAKMEERGINSVAELCRLMRMYNKQGKVGELINMKRAARNEGGEWIPMTLVLAEFFQCLPEDLFSELQQEVALEKNRSHAELAFTEISQLSARNHGQVTPEITLQASQLRATITQALSGLKPREERILRMRFGFDDGVEKTLEEISVQLGVSRDRIRQIEVLALRKLKHPARSRRILAATGSHRESRSWGDTEVADFDPDPLGAL